MCGIVLLCSVPGVVCYSLANMSLSVGKFGELNFGDWLYGLFAAFIGGGATAVVAAFSINMVDPQHFNTSSPDFYKIVLAMFGSSGLINALMFLRSKPLPDVKKVVTTTETTEVTSHPMARVVTTVEETKMVPVDNADKVDKVDVEKK